MPLFRHTDEKIIQFVNARKTIDEGRLIFKDFERNMHFTNRAVVLSADYADYADRNKENLRSIYEISRFKAQKFDI